MKHSPTVLFALSLTTLAGCSVETTSPPAASTAVPQVAAVEDAYPLDTCVVSGQKLGSDDEVVEVEIEGRLVKLCCWGCETQLRQDPAKYLAILDAAAVNATPAPVDPQPHHQGHPHDHDH